MCVVRFSLKPNGNEEMEAGKRFFVVNKLHNILVTHGKKLLNRIEKDHGYQDWLEEYRALKKKKSPSDEEAARMDVLGGKMNAFRDDIGLTESGLESYVKVWQKRHAKLVSSQQAQAEADRVWQGIKDVLFGKGEDIHYRRISEMHTIGGKSNVNGTKFSMEDMSVDWMGLRLDCYADWEDPYIREALSLDHPEEAPEISYCEIAREAYHNGYRYFAIVYFRGTEPMKGRTTGEGDFGLDPGTSAVAGAADKEVFLEELAPDVKRYDKRIADLQRRMDESKRATNPDNFNPDGTVKPKKDRKPWVFSEHYYQMLWQLRDTYRMRSAYVKQNHEERANRMLAAAEHFKVEKNNFAAMARCSKKPAEREEKASEVTKKDGTKVMVHKFKKKKRFGRSVGSRAPSMFLSILKRKVLAAGGTWQDIDPFKFKASQYRHDTDTYEKVPLGQRDKEIGGHKVQRDTYSAFLMKNATKDGTHANRNKCKKDFKKFCELQDKKIAEMKAAGISKKSVFGF